jgi:hypothetical protein
MCSDLLLELRTDFFLLPMATAVAGCPGATNDFFVGPRGGKPIFAFEAGTIFSLSIQICIRECSRIGLIGGGKNLFAIP